jgi:dihydrofolate reductase
MISAIVAVDENWGIGYQGNLLANIPDDLKRFKELTTDNIVVMGKTTWESLPKKPLPNRVNIVIDYIEQSSCHPNVFFKNLENTKSFINLNSNLNFFIIGGGSIYKQLLSICD